MAVMRTAPVLPWATRSKATTRVRWGIKMLVLVGVLVGDLIGVVTGRRKDYRHDLCAASASLAIGEDHFELVVLSHLGGGVRSLVLQANDDIDGGGGDQHAAGGRDGVKPA